MRSPPPANSRSVATRGLSAARWSGRVKSFRSRGRDGPDARPRRRGARASRWATRARRLVQVLLRAARVTRNPFWIAERSWRDCGQNREAALFVWEVADLARAVRARSCNPTQRYAAATRLGAVIGAVIAQPSRSHRAVVAPSSRRPQRGFAAVAAAARRPRARPASASGTPSQDLGPSAGQKSWRR